MSEPVAGPPAPVVDEPGATAPDATEGEHVGDQSIADDACYCPNCGYVGEFPRWSSIER